MCWPDVYVLVVELRVLVGQRVRLERVADVTHASQQHVDIVAVSSERWRLLTPVVAVQQVGSRAQRPALIDANAAKL